MEEKELEELEKSRKTPPNVCPECGEPIKGNVCEKCGQKGLKEHYFDPDYEKYEKEIEKANEEFFNNMEWEEVKENA